MAAGEDVYCTLVMSDQYLPGAAVLSHSLRDCGSTKKLACLVSADSLRSDTLEELRMLYDYVIPVERIGTPSPKNLYLMNRADLLYTFTKINLWRQTQFRRIVYIDADVVALRAPEELFDLSESFAAAPDVGWPDAFNTGLMVISPSMGDFWALHNLAAAGDSFDGADQGLINQYFEHRPWKRLSFVYNCTPSANYQYEPAYRYYKRDISLVHFIGDDKPWRQERRTHNAPGAYQELLSRWWAVYDRHYRLSAHEYVKGRHLGLSAVQSGVRSEAQQRARDYNAAGFGVDTSPAGTTELPFTDRQDIPEAEKVDQGIVEPASTSQQRRFSAPHMEWDATRAPPPSQSRPEAANFPTQVYGFNADPEPFHPPARHPDPLTDMWFKAPSDKPKAEVKLAPIFPWEMRDLPKPTRRFVEDEVQPTSDLSAATEADDSFGNIATDEYEVNLDDTTEPMTPAIQLHEQSTWDAFGSGSKNAWDEVSGIEDYVRALTAQQKKRGQLQVVQTNQPTTAQHNILSPTNRPDREHLADIVRERRESLILTDFPSAVERPSLPVTPAPVRRTSFWGDERDESGNLPAAEGVPDQIDWDPSEQLEQLRRNSLIGPSDLKLPPKRNIPNRKMFPTAAPIPEEVVGHPVANASGAIDNSVANSLPQIGEPGFGASSLASALEKQDKSDALSPTEQTPKT